MALPVVHFEIIGRDPDQLRRYYGELFGWTFETPSPVAKEVSDAGSYGLVGHFKDPDGTLIGVAGIA